MKFNSLIIPFLLIASMASAAMHADMVHFPDFTKDPNHPVHIITSQETCTDPTEFYTVVIKAGGHFTVFCELKYVNIILDGGFLDVRPGARLIKKNVSLDLAFDPEQFGHGVVGNGTLGNKWVSVGTPKLSYGRVAIEPHAGDKIITFTLPMLGWLSNDLLVFGDSDECQTDDKIDFTSPGNPPGTVNNRPRCHLDHTESRHISGPSLDGGKTWTLDSPLTYNHPGAVDDTGRMILLPFVSNHTRDIVYSSENPNGTRFHMMAAERDEVDFENNEVDDGGRTCENKLDNTTWNGNTPTHIGTCQVGRYGGFHGHHLIGTSAKQNIIRGNAFNHPGVWGAVIHDTHYSTWQNNNIWGAIGSAIVLETGQETENLVDGNLGVQTIGSNTTEEDDDIPIPPPGVHTIARRGDFIWASGPNNHITNNVCIDARARCYDFILGNSSGQVLRCSKFMGADPMLPDEGYDCRPDHMEVLQFDNNEGIRAMEANAFFYNLAKIHPVTINGFKSWHTLQSFTVANADSLTINDAYILGVCGINAARVEGIQILQNHDLTLNRPNIYCVNKGVDALTPGYADMTDPSKLNINGPGRIFANRGIGWSRDTHNQPNTAQSHGYAEVHDLTVDAAPIAGNPVNTFYFDQRPQDGMNVNVEWKWTNTNVNGKNSRIFPPEAAPTASAPNTGTWKDSKGNIWHDLVGCSQSGLTVAQCFATENVAYGGAVACDVSTDPKAYGFECPADGGGPTHTLTVHVTSNVNTIDVGKTVVLSAVVNDSIGCMVTNQWSAPSGSFSLPNALQTIWTAPANSGLIPITFTATCPADNKTASDSVSITVKVPVPITKPCTAVVTGVTTDNGLNVTVNPSSQWRWTCEQ